MAQTDRLNLLNQFALVADPRYANVMNAQRLQEEQLKKQQEDKALSDFIRQRNPNLPEGVSAPSLIAMSEFDRANKAQQEQEGLQRFMTNAAPLYGPSKIPGQEGRLPGRTEARQDLLAYGQDQGIRPDLIDKAGVSLESFLKPKDQIENYGGIPYIKNDENGSVKVAEGFVQTPAKYEERDFPLAGNMIQKQERTPEGWKNVGAPMSKFSPGVGASAGGTANDYSQWTPEEKVWWFENLKATGQKPDLGAGGASSKARQQFTRDYAEWNRKQGVTGEQAIIAGEAFKTDTKALNASIVQQQKQLGSMGSFVKNMDSQIAKVGELSKKISTFDTRLLNMPLRAVRGRIVGSPQQAKYDMYLAEIESEIGKLATGAAGSVSELSVGAQEKWAKIHDKNLSINDMLQLLQETSAAGKLRMKSVNDQLQETRDAMKNRGKVKDQSHVSTLTDAELLKQLGGQ
jgi:hypothetical protein